MDVLVTAAFVLLVSQLVAIELAMYAEDFLEPLQSVTDRHVLIHMAALYHFQTRLHRPHYFLQTKHQRPAQR
jgi:hypothetical protein